MSITNLIIELAIGVTHASGSHEGMALYLPEPMFSALRRELTSEEIVPHDLWVDIYGPQGPIRVWREDPNHALAQVRDLSNLLREVAILSPKLLAIAQTLHHPYPYHDIKVKL